MGLSYEQALEKLTAEGQEHVLHFWNQLDATERKTLLQQIESLNFIAIRRMKRMLDGPAASPKSEEVVRPVDVVELDAPGRRTAEEAGAEELNAGKVGLILVAGGQGSRLGYDGPKGCYPVGPVSGCSLFEIHARKVLGLETTYGTEVPWYIMTSQANNDDTIAFFEQNDYFGLAPERVKFFVQGMWPALDPDGMIMLDQPGHIFMSPDGHGGTLSALTETGMLADMTERGIETLFYFQVDNPMVEIADPAFVGLHVQHQADASLKLCAKRDPMEGLGVPVMQGDICKMVEYTELTDAQRYATREDGQLKFLYGSVAIHIFSRDFLEKEADLPLHVAHKKVPYCSEDGKTIRPESNNAYKFEKFIFDLLPNAQRVLNVAFDRNEEFSPVKNAEGNDSPATCRRDLSAKWARWLEQCGVHSASDDEGHPLNGVEIDPALALNPQQLSRAIKGDICLKSSILLR